MLSRAHLVSRGSVARSIYHRSLIRRAPCCRGLTTAFTDPLIGQLFGGVVNEPRAGTVLQVQEDMVARVSGLRDARLHSIVEFENAYGVVLDLEQSSVAVALLDSPPPATGSECTLSDVVLGFPVGEAMLGRVVDPLGRPLSGLDPLKAAPLDSKGLKALQPSLSGLAPGIMARKPLCERLVTGIKAVDAFHPIGHGQCLGLMGKKGSGKSSLALHVMLNQKEPNAAAKTEAEKLRCIYVAVGQEEKTIKRTVATLKKEGCLDFVTVIAAPATATAGLRFLAPFAGAAMGEFWRNQGGRSLVIIDDLSSHAASNAEIARFIPNLGADAGLGVYGPLFERFAQLSDAKGGGSMTGLMLVEGEAVEGEVGSALAHKINSIADHAIMLNVDLAKKRVFPAVDVTYQMNVQSPGAALLPTPMKAFVRNLRTVLAELIDEEAGAKTAEELGIKVEDEEVDKAERLVYLAKIREIFRQQLGRRVDDEGLLLYLLCSLKGFLQDLDLKGVRQLDEVITTELPKAKGWQKLSKELATILTAKDSPSTEEAVQLYQRVFDVLFHAVEYSKLKAIAAPPAPSAAKARSREELLAEARARKGAATKQQ